MAIPEWSAMKEMKPTSILDEKNMKWSTVWGDIPEKIVIKRADNDDIHRR